jgi:hypothetical protein
MCPGEEMPHGQRGELQVVLPQVRLRPELQVRPVVLLLVQVLTCHLKHLAPLLELVLLLDQWPVQHWLVPPWHVLQLPLLPLHLLLVLHENQSHYQACPPSRLPRAPIKSFPINSSLSCLGLCTCS